MELFQSYEVICFSGFDDETDGTLLVPLIFTEGTIIIDLFYVISNPLWQTVVSNLLWHTVSSIFFWPFGIQLFQILGGTRSFLGKAFKIVSR